MFRLHDKTRRRICLAGFLLLCVLPTALVSAWCVVRRLPGRTEAEARRLGRQLGLRVSLAKVRHLRPGVVLYEGLELADPESGRSVARCRLLQAGWSRATGGQSQSETSLVMIASQPEIESEALGLLGELLRRLLTRQSGRTDVEVWLSAGEVTLRAEENSQTLTELQGHIERADSVTRAEVSFRLAGAETSEAVGIRICRNHHTKPPTSSFELDTRGAELPCRMLAMGLAELTPLGPRSRFRGYIWAKENPGGQACQGWEGEVTGQLLDVDLERLVTDQFPHKLSGTAEITVQSARFRGGRLEEGVAVLAAGPGVISGSLIDAAAGRLRMVCRREPPAGGDLMTYERLAVAALMDQQGLTFQGRCPDAQPGTIMADGHGPLLSEPPEQPQPVVLLLQALVPAYELQVPACRQTDWLMGHLPVADIVPPEDPRRALPHARVRLGRGLQRR